MSRRRGSRYLAKLDAAFLRAARDDARAAQDGRCRYCRDRITTRTATADHVVARACFGRDDRNNIVAACAPCNRLKGLMPVRLFVRMIERPRSGEPITYRLVNFRLRINLALERMERRVGAAVRGGR